MEFTKQDMKMTKGVAIMFMLLLHLFCRKDVHGLYDTYPLINGVPLIYYIGLFGDACVPIYCFASGYGLFLSIKNSKGQTIKKNGMRIFKLLINFWIILFLFVGIGGLAGKSETLPGDPIKFILNFFVLSNSYNGAWWFLQTYILLVLLAPALFKIVRKCNSYVLISFSGFVYLITYIQRIKHVIDLGDNSTLNMTVNAIVLLGTSQLPFIVGAVFAKEKIYTKISKKFNRISMKNVFCLLGILLLAVIHGFYESMIIAPITGITFICLFNLIDKSKFLQKILDYFGTHSTNIWLTHMFFYMTIFPSLVFAVKYPILIFCWLISLCLISSHIVNFIYKPLILRIDKNNLNLSNTKRAIG
ncbi:acyltransferase [Bacillus sp. MUM 116]|uniref:acyltransferase family protein n=1 Tax=Bacillus sp. MUM 116 TaxID=1678002 RepID=UPI0008F5E4F1|nr:acyltransferase family protein [Bacillus sp. MUM 116]OIK15467.1 acyltransferase [Bacillus sp. MUM 116]